MGEGLAGTQDDKRGKAGRVQAHLWPGWLIVRRRGGGAPDDDNSPLNWPSKRRGTTLQCCQSGWPLSQPAGELTAIPSQVSVDSRTPGLLPVERVQTHFKCWLSTHRIRGTLPALPGRTTLNRTSDKADKLMPRRNRPNPFRFAWRIRSRIALAARSQEGRKP